jgi:voltage-gated sodium channel
MKQDSFLYKLTHFFIDKKTHTDWMAWPLLTKIRFHKPNWFDNGIILVILFSAVIAGLETDMHLLKTYSSEFHLANMLIHYIFVFEVLIKLYAYAKVSNDPMGEYALSKSAIGRIGAYFTNGWNLFDVFIVLIGFVPLLITADMGSYEAVLATRTLRIFRSLRTLRVLRIIEMLPQLRVIVDTLLRSLPSLWVVVVLMAILFYTYGVIGTFLFGENSPADFGSLPASLLTLFKIMTGDGWSDYMAANADLNAIHPHPILSPMYFISFVLIAAMVVLNLFVGVIVAELDSTHKEHANDKASNGMKELSNDQILAQIEEEQLEFQESVSLKLTELRKRLAK